MSYISAYLSFSGNCRQAMSFYQECLGGKLTFQRVGDFPMTKKLPVKMKECILHSTLVNKNVILMGTDLIDEAGLRKGNSVALFLSCASEKEFRMYHRKLSAGGIVLQPVRKSHWGSFTGNVTDKFGNQWMLYYHKK